ncbi:MAG: hypothetical protein GEU88_13770 [Solirubrobacterales bacterium]|nr:hypothetical protein [Solirubrobacterales bacterium]
MQSKPGRPWRPERDEPPQKTSPGVREGALFVGDRKTRARYREPTVITSKDNEKLKLIRKLADRKHREREGLFVAEGEDLVAAAEAAGAPAAFVLRAGEDVEARLLDSVSALGSGTRVIGVYRRARAGDDDGFRVYLHGVADPGNVGAVVRTAHALLDARVVVGPGCADPFGPKAVRASMGSVFGAPPIAGGAGGSDRRPGRPRGRAPRRPAGRGAGARGRARGPAARGPRRVRSAVDDYARRGRRRVAQRGRGGGDCARADIVGRPAGG